MRRAQATMDVPSCRSLSTLRPWGSLMVEIGPEGGRRHNSPLIIPLPFEGRRPEAPLGSGRRNYSLATAFTPQPILHSVYFYFVTSTITKQGRK
jgi:hypothetical protein